MQRLLCQQQQEKDNPMQHATPTATPRSLLRPLLVTYGLCLVVQLVGSYFTTQSVTSWYPTLEKSPLTPPGYMFGVVWTILYVMMAVAAARIVRRTGRWNSRPLRWWFIQLMAGLLWTMLFFGMRDVDQALLVLSLAWAATVLSVIYFWRTERLAGLLMLPLLAWVSFACYLNNYIVLHN